ncbi:TraK family protein [Donghicola sp. C2-DW-16]|uniref:TraK family protein n=1 Tax=Donghicola mangrovi TaxID=2729614 RepID=A0ABX2PIL5_9RHOB|nr:hypothetical protein [Donghicola mangrovi]NVO29363.1 TraK family protein [Donghicola mangrovi]
MCKENEFTRAKKALMDLKTQPPKRPSALKALIRGLVDEIQDAMRRGYTLSEIVAALNAKRGPGDQINYFTFRNYLQKARAERGLAPVQPKRAKAPARAPSRPLPEMTRPKDQTPSAPRQPDAQKALQIPSPTTFGRNMKEGL